MQKGRVLGLVLAAMLMSIGAAEGVMITKVEVAQAIPVSLSYSL